MDWQTLMTELEKWLWQSPYLDLPNYVWLASALGILVMLLYLLLAFLPPEKEKPGGEGEMPLSPPAEGSFSPSPPSSVGEETPGHETPPPPTTESRTSSEPAPPPLAEATAEEEKEPPPPETSAASHPAPEKIAAPSSEVEAERPGAVAEAAPPPAAPAEEEMEVEPAEGWLSRLRKGLAKTQSRFIAGLERLLSSGKLDDDLMAELEELLITSDLGVRASTALLERLQAAVSRESLRGRQEIRDWLRREIEVILAQVEAPLVLPPGQNSPFVIMVTGVNGTGKTTTIGKMALRFRQEGKSVLLGAADTFRAAAIQQLEIWAQRAAAPLIKHQEGADPSAVAFDTIKAGVARGADVILIDTAGRLHTKVNLMEELKKVKRIIGRELAGAPHEILLVLDATTGQNALQQARMFHEALNITGLILTKLDGTAKGGIIVAISDEFKIPIRFIGVGEKISDLQPFRAADFVEALFS